MFQQGAASSRAKGQKKFTSPDLKRRGGKSLLLPANSQGLTLRIRSGPRPAADKPAARAGRRSGYSSTDAADIRAANAAVLEGNGTRDEVGIW